MKSHSHQCFLLSMDAPLISEDATVSYCGAVWCCLGAAMAEAVAQGPLDPAQVGRHRAPLSIRD